MAQKTKKSSVLQKQKKHLWSSHLLYYKEPLALDRGEGVYVYDVEENKYLDFFGGILTTSVGHNHPKIVEKISTQAAKIIHSSSLYPNENSVNLAEKIAKIAPSDLETSYFTTSGTEADELAVLLARVYSGNYDLIALRYGYSGNSSLGKSLTAQSNWRFESNITSGIKHTHNGYCYRCPFGLKPETCGTACAHDLEDLIKTTTSGKVAGILFEPIQGVGGFITPPPDFLKIVSEITRHYGGVVISDEVQGGFGRTGKHWFSVDHWGVKPDIITMAKGIANGMPIGCVTTSQKIANSMQNKGLLLSTFGGNPLTSAAALATIEVLEQEANPKKVAKLGKILRVGLEKLMEKYSLIGEVRGKGLMQAIELVLDKKTKEPAPKAVNQLFEETKKLGLLIGKGGLYGNVIRISPPLTVNKNQIEIALTALDKAFFKTQKIF